MRLVIAEGEVVIKADGTKVAKDVVKGIDSRVGDFDGPGKRSGNTFLKGFAGILTGGALLGIASQVGDLIGRGISAGIDFAGEGVQMAGSLSELRSAINSTFGEETGAQLQKWAERGTAELGMTRAAALGAAKDFGIFASAADLSGDEAFNFSTDLVSLARDFASFHDVETADAIAAIGAGLRGEAEPLRQFGILMDDAALKAKALEMGIWDGEGALSAQQKILAAQKFILENAGAAMGDYEATSGSMANQQRLLGDSLEEVQTKLGEALLPAFTEFVTFANENIVPILDDVIDDIGPQLSAALEQAGPLLQEFLEKVGPHLPGLIDFGVRVLPDIVNALAGLIEFADDASVSADNFFGAVKVVTDFLNGDTSLDKFLGDLEDLADGFSDPLRAAIHMGTGISRGLDNAIGGFRNFSREAGHNIGQFLWTVGQVPRRVGEVFNGAGNWLARAGRDIINGLINGIKGAMGWLRDTLGGVTNLIPKWKGPPEKDASLLTPAGRSIMGGLISGIRAELPALRGTLGDVTNTIGLDGYAARLGGGAQHVATSRPSGAVASSGGGGNTFHLTQEIHHSDPIIAGRQAARAFTERLGV